MLVGAKIYCFSHFISYNSSSTNSDDQPRASYKTKQNKFFPNKELDNSTVCEFVLEISNLIERVIDVSVCCHLLNC
jgi:hypothetical protein